MKRLIVLVTLAGVAALPVAALAASTGKTHHYTDHLVGALVQTQGKTSVYAYKVQSNDSGPGASVSVNTLTSSTAGDDPRHELSSRVDLFARSAASTLGAATTSGLA